MREFKLIRGKEIKLVHNKNEINNLVRKGYRFLGSKVIEDEIIYKCDVCNNEFDSQKILDEHKQIHAKKPYLCGYCKEKFKTELEFTEHLTTHEENTPPIDNKSKTLINLVDEKTIEDEFMFKCPLCSNQYKTEKGFTKHMNVIHKDLNEV